MKKICFVTAARSEYGCLKWLMKDVNESEEFLLQLVVTGGHLLYEQGHTVDQIINDGFNIEAVVDAELNTSSSTEIAKSMGRMAERFAKAFDELSPDYVLVLGDRYELLPVCNTAFIMGIPIIHLSGGDVTEGALDDGIRNAVTMLAQYHFAGNISSARNIARMRGNDKNVWSVGEPGLDAFNREELWTREKLVDELGLNYSSRWVLMTYHAETKRGLHYNISSVEACINALTELDNTQVVVTYANADEGGIYINEYIEKMGKQHSEKLKVVPSLGHLRYLSYMKQVEFVIGNSSSGIIESPFLNIPTINIGDRQKGRYLCGNIIQCDADLKSIKKAINEIPTIRSKTITDCEYWGDGHTSEQIIEILKCALSGD